MNKLDVRAAMIVLMLLMLGGGAWLRDFSIRPEQVLLTFAAGLLTHFFFLRRLELRDVGYLSAMITCMGISLLLRADNLWAHPAAASAAMASKFLIRFRGKHIFNPANFAVIAALNLLPGTWVSPGQWGADIATLGWLLTLGALATGRAGSSDTSWSFLVFFLGALWVRVMLLGQIPAVWQHSLSNGALLLFTFFMISDPKTSPDHRAARVLHAALVAGLAYGLMFGPYLTNSFLWALFIASPFVALWDALFKAPKFDWRLRHETQPTDVAAGGPLVGAAAGFRAT